MFDARTIVEPRWVLTFLLAIGLAGCGGDEATPVAEESRDSVEVDAHVETPQLSTPPVQTEPVATEPERSPEQLAAYDAFRTMTTEGVSQQELDGATQEIQDLGADALPALTDGLQSEEPIKREMAATMLALLGPEAASVSESLVEALDDESDFVRANLATALAQMEGQAPHVIPVFGEFLESDDPNLQTMAAMNLGVIDPVEAKPLVEQLTNTLDNEDPAILLPVVELLGKIGPDAQPAVEKIKSLDTTDNMELETAVNVAVMQIETSAE